MLGVLVNLFFLLGEILQVIEVKGNVPYRVSFADDGLQGDPRQKAFVGIQKHFLHVLDAIDRLEMGAKLLLLRSGAKGLVSFGHVDVVELPS